MDAHKKNATIGTMVLLNLINFGLVGFWSFDGAVMLPFLQTQFGIGNAVGGYIVGIGKLMIALSFFFGVFSDKTVSRMGKRRPLMLLGGLISAPLIALIPHMTNIWALVAALTVCYFGIQFAAVPYFSLVPEVIPNEKLGTANAFFSAFGGIGTLLAYAVLFSIIYTSNKFLAFYVLAAVHLGCTLATVFSIKEFVPDKLPEPESRFKAMAMSLVDVARDLPKYRDLTIFLISNLFFWLGLGVFVQFFTKFMEFYANIPNEPAGYVLGAIVIVSVILAVPVGIIGDKISRKHMVFAGMLTMFAALVIAYFVIGPKSSVSNLDLGSPEVVASLAQQQKVDVSGADFSPFVKDQFVMDASGKKKDINEDGLPDKKSEAMRWCLNGGLDEKGCGAAVSAVMGADNPARENTLKAMLALNKHVTSETKGVIKIAFGVISFAAIGMTICVVIMATILPTLMPESKMGLYMGFYSTVTGLGQFLSVVIAGTIIQKTLTAGNEALGYRWMFIQGAVCMLIAAIVVISVPYIPKANEPTITELEKQGEELARQLDKAQQPGKGGGKKSGGARPPQSKGKGSGKNKGGKKKKKK